MRANESNKLVIGILYYFVAPLFVLSLSLLLLSLLVELLLELLFARSRLSMMTTATLAAAAAAAESRHSQRLGLGLRQRRGGRALIAAKP